ncbi:hypothetical protein BDZ45DRAFT_697330 [Acephala macrosclerotiorum]|nr:hypothetical protein BDZ45DRAFT_697330 [Acephala macrosclerotiorum]
MSPFDSSSASAPYEEYDRLDPAFQAAVRWCESGQTYQDYYFHEVPINWDFPNHAMAQWQTLVDEVDAYYPQRIIARDEGLRTSYMLRLLYLHINGPRRGDRHPISWVNTLADIRAPVMSVTNPYGEEGTGFLWQGLGPFAPPPAGPPHQDAWGATEDARDEEADEAHDLDRALYDSGILASSARYSTAASSMPRSGTSTSRAAPTAHPASHSLDTCSPTTCLQAHRQSTPHHQAYGASGAIENGENSSQEAYGTEEVAQEEEDDTNGSEYDQEECLATPTIKRPANTNAGSLSSSTSVTTTASSHPSSAPAPNRRYWLPRCTECIRKRKPCSRVDGNGPCKQCRNSRPKNGVKCKCVPEEEKIVPVGTLPYYGRDKRGEPKRTKKPEKMSGKGRK